MQSVENRNLHVLILPTWYPNGKDKLMGIYHKQFASALAAHGVTVNMLYIDRQGMRLWPKYPFMKKQGVESEDGYTVYLRKMPDLTKISHAMQRRAYARYLVKLYRHYEKRHGKPDIIHAQVTLPAGYAACRLGERFGIPVVITEHASYFERFFDGKDSIYGRYAAEHAAAFTCVSHYMCDLCRKRGFAASVLPNIVDCSSFLRERKDKADVRLHFVTVSALRPGKRIDHAILALRALREKQLLPPFTYTVVGDGSEEERFRRLAVECEMTDCVSFVGRKTKEEIAAILAESDVLLMASDIETFGIPAVEALAAGVPVVSTKCRGPEGFLTEACAELCDCGSPDALADAILRMVTRLSSIQPVVLRQTAAQFDAPSVAQTAVALYRKVLSDRPTDRA